MTAPGAGQPQVLPRPACTPTAIRAVLAANADGDILQRYDEDLDAAFEQAREQGDITPAASRPTPTSITCCSSSTAESSRSAPCPAPLPPGS